MRTRTTTDTSSHYVIKFGKNFITDIRWKIIKGIPGYYLQSSRFDTNAIRFSSEYLALHWINSNNCLNYNPKKITIEKVTEVIKTEITSTRVVIPAKVKDDWQQEFRLMAAIRDDNDINFWQIKRAEALYSSLYQNMPEKMTHILTFANTLDGYDRWEELWEFRNYVKTARWRNGTQYMKTGKSNQYFVREDIALVLRLGFGKGVLIEKGSNQFQVAKEQRARAILSNIKKRGFTLPKDAFDQAMKINIV